MAKLSKKEKLRKTLLSTVKANKHKFDPRAYSSIIKKINSYNRIDFLNKFGNSLDVIINTDEKNLTILKIKKLNKIKQDIIIVDNKYNDVLKVVFDNDNDDLLLVGNIQKEQLKLNSDLSASKKRELIFYTFFYIRPEEKEDNTKIYISKNIRLDSKKIIQLYKNGTTNCVFKPIIEWCDLKMNESKTKSTCDKYKYKKNICKKLEKKYHDNGVSNDDLQLIANELQINLKLTKPFQNEFTIYRSNKKPLVTFDLVNVKKDHVELNKIVNNKPKKLSFDEMQNLYNQLIESNEYFVFTKGSNGICRSISTIDCRYILINEYEDFINEFEQKTGIANCKLCSVNNT